MPNSLIDMYLKNQGAATVAPGFLAYLANLECVRQVAPEAARAQVARVATARDLPSDKVLALVEQQIEPPQLAIFGDTRVNVLLLNLALDTLH